MKVALTQIEKLASLITQGIQAFEKAGQLWVEMLDASPDGQDELYKEVPRLHPLLTVDKLVTLERVGRKQLLPELVFDNSYVSRTLSLLPYRKQVECLGGPIEVAVLRNGEVCKEKRLLKEMTQKEVRVAIGPQGPRPISQQEKLLKEMAGKRKMPRYEIVNGGIRFMDRTVWGREQIEKILQMLPGPVLDGLQTAMRNNQIKSGAGAW